MGSAKDEPRKEAAGMRLVAGKEAIG